jgi:hypothetical protein
MSIRMKLFALILLVGGLYFVSSAQAGPTKPQPMNEPSCNLKCILEEEACMNDISEVCGENATCENEQRQICISDADECSLSCAEL